MVTMLQWLATVPAPPEESVSGDYGWVTGLIPAVLAVALIAFFVYMLRPTRWASGFTIHVDEEEIAITGDFPGHLQAMVIDFLRNDCHIPGSYKVRGHWEGGRLVIAVEGANARPVEQQIRNFLKLNVTVPPRRR